MNAEEIKKYQDYVKLVPFLKEKIATYEDQKEAIKEKDQKNKEGTKDAGKARS